MAIIKMVMTVMKITARMDNVPLNHPIIRSKRYVTMTTQVLIVNKRFITITPLHVAVWTAGRWD